MKSYTDLEQSKKLAEILSIESADMYYQYVLPKSGKIKHNPEIGNPLNALKWYNKGYTTSGKGPITLNEYCVPCWSLEALLEVMPKQLGRYTLTFYWCDDSWCCSYIDDGSEIKEISSASNPVDATVEMIVKLKEKDLLDTGQGIPFSCEHNAHLWTIDDAKDGDVLVHNGCPFIFMGIKDGIVQALEENLLEGTNPVNFGEPKNDKDYQPATEEQRDTLFAKMADAGYEWDADKKEVKKIESKKLDADNVIAWLVANICDFEFYVKLFKKDFGL